VATSSGLLALSGLTIAIAPGEFIGRYGGAAFRTVETIGSIGFAFFGLGAVSLA
jgi:hypothetical protein